MRADCAAPDSGKLHTMAKQITADEESILKKQARRRLIGAIALTTAVVIVLPLVLDGEPPATKVSNIELRIPDKDKVAELPPVAPASSVLAASSVLQAASSVQSASTVPAVPPTSAVMPATASMVAAPIQAAAVLQHLPVAVAEQPKAAANPAPQEHKVEAKQKVESKPAVVNNSIPHTGFVVQVGAFANSEAAKKLQEKLVAQGLHAYTEKVGHNVRVRVGGFSTHEAADKVRHKIEAQGMHPNVVNLGN